MTAKTKHWLEGLWRAIITGVANSFLIIAIDPTGFNPRTLEGWKGLGPFMLLSTAIRLAEYLKRHPLPGVTHDTNDIVVK